MPKFIFLITPFLLAGSLYSFTGGSARPPVILGPKKICTEPWACRNDAALKAAGDAIARGERTLRIASYNVHKCTGMDARRDPERIAEVIRSLDADIVSLQEVLSDPAGEAPSAQVRYLAEKTGMYAAVAGPTKRKKDGMYGNALLTRFPIAEVRLHDISFGPFEPRGIIDADIVIGGRTIRVVATHFGLWPRERYQQAGSLLKILAGQTSSPLIVMGDMNGWVPGSPELQRLNNRLGRPVSMASFPSSFPILSLDKIWVLPSEHLEQAGVHRSPLARIASDHLPLVATLYLHNSASRPSASAARP